MYNLIVDKNIILTDNGEIIEQYENNNNALEGNIYIAKVKNVLKGMEASFVDIGEGKNALLKSNNFKVNDKIIVQVRKEPTNKKGAIVTEKIQLPGKYIVLLPTENYISISKKIVNEQEVIRLKGLVKNNINGYGAIIRTTAQNETEKILKEIDELTNLWNKIKIKNDTAPFLIYKEDIAEKVIKGLTDKNISKIITTNPNAISKILEKLKLSIPIEISNTNMKIQDIKKNNVWLKSGGYITINQTEALVAIDVNSGSYTGKDNLEVTAKKINKEATIEIAKQIRIRNLRGIIIIDYINLKSETTKNEIIELMEKETKKDRSKVEVYGFTKLNLLEMTRKHL